MAGRTRRRLARASLAVVLAAGGLSTSARPTIALDDVADYTPFVYRVGSELYLEGEPFQFSGLNLYYANNTRNDGCTNLNLHEGTQLDDALTAMGPGNNVLRAWFFQNLAQSDISGDGGVRDWAAFDHTLEVAAAHGMKVIATLSDQWGECGDGAINGFKNDAWYRDGYRQVDTGNLASYRDWVAEVVTRYRNDPRIAFWQLMNEAEVKSSMNAACLPGANESFHVLDSWARDVAALVKSIDPNHLLSLGTMGGGQCGAQDWEYQSLHEIPAIDLCEYHDYSPNDAMPGDQWNGLGRRIAQCAAVNKPIFVGEVGIIPTAVGGSLVDRAVALDNKLRVQRAAGVAGHVVWAWSIHGSSQVIYDIGADDPVLDVLAHAPPTDTELISVATNGAQGEGDSGNAIRGVAISGDGRFVAFTGSSTTLVPGSTGQQEVFVRDRALGTLTFAVDALSGGRPNSWVSGVALSATGRFVVVKSPATDLVGNDTNGLPDIFVHDRLLDTTALVSVASNGSQMTGDGPGHSVDISATGRYVVFDTQGGGLVAGIGSGFSHVYLRDRDTDGDGVFDEPGAVSTTLMSADATGTAGNGASYVPSISPNGRFVAISSEASNLVADDAPACEAAVPEPQPSGEEPAPSDSPPDTFAPANCLDVFVRDRDVNGNGIYDQPGDREVVIASRTSDGAQANGNSVSPSVSNAGDVAFWSVAPNLGAPDGIATVFVNDRQDGLTVRVGDQLSNLATISADGRYVGYDSFVANGVSADTNGVVDAFVYDRTSGASERVSVTANGAQSGGGGFQTLLDDAGRFVAFGSFGADLVPGDVNGRFDVFVRDRAEVPPPPGATETGSGIVVVPADAATGATPVTVSFSSITAPGVTTLATSSGGPQPPSGITFGNPAVHYDVSTSATYAGAVTLCFEYDEASVDESTLALYHYDAVSSAWQNVTSGLDAAGNVICGTVTSLSPFALGSEDPGPRLDGIIETTNLASYDHAILVYSEPIDASSIPDRTDFSITVNGVGPVLPTDVKIAYQGFIGSDIADADGFALLELRLPSPVTQTDETLIRYAPGAQPIRDAAGNEAEGFPDTPIEYLDGAGAAAAFMDEGTGPYHVVFVFLEPVLEPLPDAADFTVVIEGATTTPASVSVMHPGYGIGLVDLKLETPVQPGDTVTLTYEQGSTPLVTQAGTVVESFANQPVSNSLATTSSRSTPVGTDVTVTPVDSSDGGGQPVSLTFQGVASPGITTLETSATGPELPDGFALGDPPLYFDISTTAGFVGAVTVCIGFDALTFDDPSQLRLMHFEAEAWADVTTSVDLAAEIICGRVTSFSPFAIVEEVGPTFTFSGFFSPVDNLPSANAVKAARAFPVKFSLGGDYGLEIFEEGFPSSRRVDCTTGVRIDQIEETVTTGASSLKYDAASGRYHYVWKTQTAWAGQCRELTLTFIDGSTATALFKFEK